MVALITGASGGFGRVLGTLLVEQGMTVYGTTRRPDPAPGAYPFHPIAMEVTDADSVERCVSEIVGREGRIDVVINCVNQLLVGSVEEETAEEVRALLDVNVVGMLRVCKQVIPIMRRQGQGTIINMSSLAGVVAVPYMSAYTAAKWAIEGLTEAMYQELKPHGIDVVIMQPVAMKMDRAETGTHLALVEHVPPDSFSHKIVRKMAEDTLASKLTPEMVAAKVLEVISRKKKPLRVPMDRAVPVSLIRGVAPQSIIDRLIGGFLREADQLG